MKHRLFFKLLVLCWTFYIFSCAREEPLPEDHRRGFDQAYLESLNEHHEYDYDRSFDTKSKDQDSQQSSSLWKLIGMLLSGIAWFFNSVLGYLVIGALIILLIRLLIKNSDRIFEKKDVEDKEKLLEVKPVEVEDEEYQKLINVALKERDYRLAIRFGFLSILKYLHEEELIQWKIDKTNLDYQLELPETYHDAFTKICWIYERIWYGEFNADKEIFKQMTRTFKELKTYQST